MSNVNKGVNQANEILFFLGLSVGANVLQFIRNTDYKRQADKWQREYEKSEGNAKRWHSSYSEYFSLYHATQEKLNSIKKEEQ